MESQKVIVIILVSLILSASIFGYGFLNYKSKQDSLKLEQEKLQLEQQKIEREDKETQEKEIKFRDCKLEAENRYHRNWDGTCVKLSKEEKCSLPSDTAERLDQLRRSEIEDCVKLYSVIQ